MKIWKLVLLSVTIVGCDKIKNSAITQNNQNTSMYVSARSGLVLRSKPDKTSEKITILPQNTEVRIIEKTDVKEIIGNTSGHWINIKVESSGKTGYVFDGFLSSSRTSNFTDIPCNQPVEPDDHLCFLDIYANVEAGSRFCKPDKELISDLFFQAILSADGIATTWGFENPDATDRSAIIIVKKGNSKYEWDSGMSRIIIDNYMQTEIIKVGEKWFLKGFQLPNGNKLELRCFVLHGSDMSPGR